MIGLSDGALCVMDRRGVSVWFDACVRSLIPLLLCVVPVISALASDSASDLHGRPAERTPTLFCCCLSPLCVAVCSPSLVCLCIGTELCLAPTIKECASCAFCFVRQATVSHSRMKGRELSSAWLRWRVSLSLHRPARSLVLAFPLCRVVLLPARRGHTHNNTAQRATQQRRKATKTNGSIQNTSAATQPTNNRGKQEKAPA